MSQRVAGCCCSPPCDPTLGACCTKVGGVCGCIENKTLCECTKLGGAWNANNLCPNGCKGSCCKISMSNVLVNCTDNITECDCDAMAVAGRYRTTFHRGFACANSPCSTCLRTHTCQNNLVFNVAVATDIYTFSNSYVCACYQDNPRYNNRSGSQETSHPWVFSGCQLGFPGPFVTWYGDLNTFPACFNIGQDNTETIVTDCDEGGLTGSVTHRFETKFVMLGQINVPPCGTWIKAGTFRKEMVTMGSGCDCYLQQSGNGEGEYAYTTTFCWPPQDWPLAGCNCLPISQTQFFLCQNFDIVNPYNSTTSTCIPGTDGTSSNNNCP